MLRSLAKDANRLADYAKWGTAVSHETPKGPDPERRICCPFNASFNTMVGIRSRTKNKVEEEENDSKISFGYCRTIGIAARVIPGCSSRCNHELHGVRIECGRHRVR